MEFIISQYCIGECTKCGLPTGIDFICKGVFFQIGEAVFCGNITLLCLPCSNCVFCAVFVTVHVEDLGLMKVYVTFKIQQQIENEKLTLRFFTLITQKPLFTCVVVVVNFISSQETLYPLLGNNLRCIECSPSVHASPHPPPPKGARLGKK